MYLGKTSAINCDVFTDKSDGLIMQQFPAAIAPEIIFILNNKFDILIYLPNTGQRVKCKG